VAPLVLPWRAARIAGSPWLLWSERGNTWRRSVRHMLRPFSTSRLPRTSCASRARCSLFCRRRGVLPRASPLQLANFFVGLLCVNHFTHRFRKGITPSRYRLRAHNVLSAGSGIKDDIQRSQLPAPPFPAPTGHAAFREDRQIGTVYRHAHGVGIEVCDTCVGGEYVVTEDLSHIW
jgi:hypothetical protein